MTAGATPSSALPTTMSAVVQARYGGPEILDVAEAPVPEAGRGEVLIRVEASSLNPLDWHMLTGTPYLIRLFPRLRPSRRPVPGADVAGTVVAIGSGVDDLGPGDRVFGECRGGGFAAYATAKADSVVPAPDNVDVVALGATPVAGLTALQALHTHAGLTAGERVLVNGAAGGVGTFAVQIARALGAEEITAVCSGRNAEMVRSLGATRVIDYDIEDFASDGREYDVMVDNVGNRTADECLGVLVPEGRYVAVSGPKSNRWLGPIPYVLRMRRAFRGAGPSFHQFTASPNRDDLAFLGELLTTGEVVPAIDRVIGLDAVADAFREIATGHARAKIVVRPEAADRR